MIVLIQRILDTVDSVVATIKQFVVTNCGKEQPGSIVTKTIKNGIFVPIVTSKESHFSDEIK